MRLSTRAWRATALGMALLGGAGLFASPAQAGYTVTFAQVGGNVVATGSGTIDLNGLTFMRVAGASIPFVSPNQGAVATGASGATPDVYTGFTGPASFGTGPFTDASSGSGDYVGIAAFVDQLAVPDHYVSLTPLSDSATYDNTTIAKLGMTPGTYVWTWGGTGPADDSFTVQVPSASVPEPASGLLLALPLGLLMLLGARRRVAARRA